MHYKVVVRHTICGIVTATSEKKKYTKFSLSSHLTLSAAFNHINPWNFTFACHSDPRSNFPCTPHPSVFFPPNCSFLATFPGSSSTVKSSQDSVLNYLYLSLSDLILPHGFNYCTYTLKIHKCSHSSQTSSLAPKSCIWLFNISTCSSDSTFQTRILTFPWNWPDPFCPAL